MGGVDIVPTIFNFAGIDLPWEMHGNDLTPLLENPKADWPHPVLMPATGRKYGSDTDVIPPDAFHGEIPWYVMLRDGRYKYVRALIENELEELYDLRKDPHQLKNLAKSATVKSKLKELRQTVDKLMQSTADPRLEDAFDRLPWVDPAKL